MSKIKFNSPIIEIPDQFNLITKNGSVKNVNPLTKTGGLTSRNKKKAILLETNKDINDIKIISHGEKIDKVEKIKKPRKPRVKKIPKMKKIPEFNREEKLRSFDHMIKNKKPTIKVSDPIITKLEVKPKKKVKVIKSKPIEIINNDFYLEPSLTKEQNEKLQKDLVELKKKYITNTKLQEFLVNHNLKPNKSTIDEWTKFMDLFLKNHKFNYGWNNDDIKPIEVIKKTRKPNIKVSNPIITKPDIKEEDNKINNLEDDEYKKNVINTYNKGIKDYRNNYRHFMGTYKPGESFDYKKREDYLDFNDRFIKKNFFEWENKDAKIIKEYTKNMGTNPRKGFRFTTYENPELKEKLDELLIKYNIYNPVYNRLLKEHQYKLNTNKTKKAKKSKDYIKYEEEYNNIINNIKKLLEDNKNDLYVKDLLKNDELLKDILKN